MLSLFSFLYQSQSKLDSNKNLKAVGAIAEDL